MDAFLDGYATKDHREHIVVDYGPHLSVKLESAAKVINDAINDALDEFDTVTVLGHSRGSEAAGFWLSGFGYHQLSPPAHRLRFFLLGNPRRRLGGNGGGVRTPDDTKYQVDDIARRWDKWANKDNYPGRAGANSLRLSLGSIIDHSDYKKVSLNNLQLRQQVGNTRYWMAP